MKTAPRGMALITILALLMLVAALVLAIFSSTRTERISSTLYTGSVEAGNLADTAVNLCIAQIADATRPPGDAAAPPQTWVSQPGMIRTFHGDREPGEAFRLYSWEPMRVSGAYNPFATANAVPGDWNLHPARFVDLNEPVPDLDAPGDPARDRYPILYPPARTASSGGALPAGFSLASVPGGGSNPVPMPVQWLYVLSDGSVHPAVPVEGEPRSVRIGAATRVNPIVGRIAFWADDESTKVNVNTAAGGAYWSPPWAETAKERYAGFVAGDEGFGLSQPVRGEYPRYPGHPARTDLRAVFPELSWEEIYRLTPRVVQGGSENGTRTLAQVTIDPSLDTDRLYAALGELRFAVPKARGAARTLNESAIPALDGESDLFERRKGFLTTASRSPELTLAGTPRIASWPIHALDTAPANRPYRSALDRLIAFCSTIGGKPYYFTRENPLSPDADITLPRNEALYRYLQRLTDGPFPGESTGSFATKYTGRGRDQILTEIFDYIRIINLQDMSLHSSRYYKSQGTVVPTRWNPGSGETSGFGRTYTVRQAGLMFICNADGTVAASNRPKGAPDPGGGIRENLALEPADGGHPEGGKLGPNQRRVQALFVVELFSPAAAYKQFYPNPAMKVHGLENLTVTTSAMASPVNLGFPDGSGGTATFAANIGSSNGLTGGVGGTTNYRWPMLGGNKEGSPMRATGPIPADAPEDEIRYPYIGIPVTLTFDAADPRMTLGGGTITVEIYDDDAFTRKVASATVNLQAATLPAPILHPDPARWAFHQKGIFGDYDPEAGTGTPGRFVQAILDVMDPYPKAPSNAAHFKGFISPYDAVQTHILPHGDYRTPFGPTNALKSYEPVPAATITPAFSNLRHFLSDGNRAIIGFTKGTTLTPDVAVPWTGNLASSYLAPPMRRPAAYPNGLNAPWTYGDWDTGSPWGVVDGGLINKTDEGNLFQINAKVNPYSLEYSNWYTVSGLGGVHYHSANRQMPSPVMFGSLPTGLIEGQPWQTLLFRPFPTNHPGAKDPKDRLLLDLFWMPVVEPYAISEPFSTAGKINMNWQMIPFTYIERSTGMHALLMDEKLPAIPEAGWTTDPGYGKVWAGYNPPADLYHPINIEETLQPFRSRFGNGELFISASEITDLYLVPEQSGVTYDTMPAFWETHRLTGENIKERPYAVLYPRLTTRSNVFNVHYRVQRLRKRPNTDPTLWNEDEDPAGAEIRGNTLIERFIDLNRPNLPDFATDATANAETLYRFRVLSNKRFTP